MSFTSLPFYLWLAGAVALFYLVPGKWRGICLLLLSCVFYLTWSRLYFGLLVFSTGLVYVAGERLGSEKSEKKRQMLLLAGLVPVVGLLAFFKSGPGVTGLLLPIGISYYTFKLVGYLLEVYWDEGQAERNFIDFANYATFGAQMLSGPIQRSFDFFPQLARVKQGGCDFERMERGFALILGGLLLKLLVGDRLGAFIDIVDKDPSNYAWPVLAINTLCYLLQLYADFAGYTNIAIGIGKLFGIDSPPNFRAPFAATNIQEFWRRWHMSLTSWLTDYVFMPLRIATRHWGTLGLVASLMLNMILIGLWHGFTWVFFIFGVIQGIYISVSALTLKSRDRFFVSRPILHAPRRIIGAGIVFFLVTFSMIFWRAASPASAVLHLQLLAGTVSCGPLGFKDIRTDVVEPVYLCMALAFYFGAGAPGMNAISRGVTAFVPNWVIYGLGLLLLSALTTEVGSGFIYGQF